MILQVPKMSDFWLKMRVFSMSQRVYGKKMRVFTLLKYRCL